MRPEPRRVDLARRDPRRSPGGRADGDGRAPSSVRWALGSYLPALALLAASAVAHRATGVGVVVSSDERLRILRTLAEDRDDLYAWGWVAAQAAFDGLVWFAGAAVCLVAAAVLRRQGRVRTELAWFLLALVGLTVWLGVDDVLMVHAELGPRVLSVPEGPIVLLDLLLIATVTVVFRRTVRRHDPLLLGLAVALLGTSLIIDVVAGPSDDHPVRGFLVAGLGFLGAVGWSGYLVRQGWSVVAGEHRPRAAEGVATWSSSLLQTQPIAIGRPGGRPPDPDLAAVDRRPPGHSLLDALRRDTEASGIPVPLAAALAALPLVGGVLVAATYVSWPLFIWILREDHLVEWAQFCLCLIASGIGVMAGARFARRRHWLLAGAFLVLAVGMFGLAGEEISWAQRALAFATPERMEALNDQEEFNVHNLTTARLDISQLFKLTELVLAFGWAALSILTRLPPWPLRRPLFVALSPPLFLVPAFAFAGAYRALRFALGAAGVSSDAAVAYTEWAELVLYLGIALLAVVSYTTAGPFLGSRAGRRDHGGRPRGVLSAYRGVLVVVVAAALVTVVLGLLTMESGMLPGNVN